MHPNMTSIVAINIVHPCSGPTAQMKLIARLLRFLFEAFLLKVNPCASMFRLRRRPYEIRNGH